MTESYVLSPRAQSDLENIWDYTAEHWTIDQAEFYIRQLWQDIETIATHPARGRACPEIRPGYFKYRSGVHLLFYRMTDSGIDVVRILHERMDFGLHF